MKSEKLEELEATTSLQYRPMDVRQLAHGPMDTLQTAIHCSGIHSGCIFLSMYLLFISFLMFGQDMSFRKVGRRAHPWSRALGDYHFRRSCLCPKQGCSQHF